MFYNPIGYCVKGVGGQSPPGGIRPNFLLGRDAYASKITKIFILQKWKTYQKYLRTSFWEKFCWSRFKCFKIDFIYQELQFLRYFWFAILILIMCPVFRHTTFIPALLRCYLRMYLKCFGTKLIKEKKNSYILLEQHLNLNKNTDDSGLRNLICVMQCPV